MIKEFEPPFLYKNPSIIEEKIKKSSLNLFRNKLRFIILFILYNAFFINAYIKNKYIFLLCQEFLMISPVIFFLFFYQQK